MAYLDRIGLLALFGVVFMLFWWALIIYGGVGIIRGMMNKFEHKNPKKKKKD